jgi:hypothetical protein
MPSFRGLAHALRARLARHRGALREALAELDRAQKIAESIGLLPQVALCHEVRAATLLADAPMRAEIEARHAGALYQTMGFRAELDRLRRHTVFGPVVTGTTTPAQHRTERAATSSPPDDQTVVAPSRAT